METGGDGGCGEFSRPAEATNADPPGCGLDGSSQPFSGGDQFSAFEKAGLQPPAARGGQEDDSFCGDFRGPAATESNDALFQDVAYDNVPPQLDNNHESSQTFKDSDEDALGKPRETFGASAAVEPSGGEPQCTCGRVEGSGTLREDREGGHIGVHEEDEHDSFASAKDSGGFPFPAAEDSCRGGAAGGEYVLGDEGVFGTLAATSQRGEDRVRGEEKVEGNFGVFAMAAGRGQDPVRGDEGDFGAFAMTARGSEDPVGGDEGDFGAFLTTARGREGPLAGNEEDGVDFGAFATTTEEPGGGDVLGDEGGFGAFATKAHRGDDRVGCDEGDEGDFGAFRTTVGGGQDPLGGDKGNFGAFTATTGAGGGHVGCEEEVEGGLGAFAMTAGAGDDRVGGEEEDGVDFVAFATTKEGREHMFENHGGHGGFAATGQSGENHDGGEVEDEGDFGAFATSKEDLLEDEGDFGAFAMTGGEPVEANEEDGSDPGGCAANSKGDPRNVQGEGDGDNFEVSPSKSGAVAGASRGGESQGFGGFAMTDEADKAASDWGGNDDAGFGDFAEPGGDDGFGEFEDGGFTSAPPPATAPPPMAPPPPDHGDGILGKSGEVLLASLAKLLEPLGRVAGLEESAPEGGHGLIKFDEWQRGRHGGGSVLLGRGGLYQLALPGGKQLPETQSSSCWAGTEAQAEFMEAMGLENVVVPLDGGAMQRAASRSTPAFGSRALDRGEVPARSMSSSNFYQGQSPGSDDHLPSTPSKIASDPFSASGPVMSLNDYLRPSAEERAGVPREGTLPAPGGPPEEGSEYDPFGIYMALQAAKNTPMPGTPPRERQSPILEEAAADLDTTEARASLLAEQLKAKAVLSPPIRDDSDDFEDFQDNSGGGLAQLPVSIAVPPPRRSHDSEDWDNLFQSEMEAGPVPDGSANASNDKSDDDYPPLQPAAFDPVEQSTGSDPLQFGYWEAAKESSGLHHPGTALPGDGTSFSSVEVAIEAMPDISFMTSS